MAIFGNNVIRLLREKWRTPTILAEELYALLQSDTPIEITSPVQITKKNPNLPALSITNNVGGTSFKVDGGTVDFSNVTNLTLPAGDTISGGGGGTGGESASVSSGPGRVTSVRGGEVSADIYAAGVDVGPTAEGASVAMGEGSPAPAEGDWLPYVHAVERTETDAHGGSHKVTTYHAALPPGGGGGFLGTVNFGEGDSYNVRFYGHGSQKPSTGSGAVRIPNLLRSVTLPIGTWIGPIIALHVPAADGEPAATVYECLVPIWM